MPGRRSRTVFLLFAFACLAVVCGLGGGGVLITLSHPQGPPSLGAASPSLDPLQRTVLSAYLLVRAPALASAAGQPEAKIDLEVQPGETAAGVIQRLHEQGVVTDGALLRLYMRYRGFDVGVQAGHYALDGAMTVRQLAEALQTARPDALSVTVPEGWRREQIAAALKQVGVGFTPDDFLAATDIRPSAYSFAGEIPEPPSVEGFLFPDTYQLKPDGSAGDLVVAMLDNFERRVTPEMRSGFAQQGLSLYQAVTLASIVEREAVVAEERPVIASVYLNRLAGGMSLDADPTVQYALGLQPDGQWWKAPLSLTDLEVVSAYNTYVHQGLPPGPIANPGLDSLRAVAFPAQTSYLYFRALCDGSGRHTFSETFEEHLNKACQ
jgi:UPF0755 protein